MGTYSKSNFGQIVGKVGNAVGGKWRGVDYLRSLPAKSKKAHTPDQLAIHARFALSATKLSPIKDVLSIGFSDKKQAGMSGYNAAVKAFIATAITGTYPNFTVDYPELQLSKGPLGKLRSTSISFNGNLSIGWLMLSDQRTSFIDDVVMIVVFNETTDMYLVNESAVRGDGIVQIDIAAETGEIVHAWAFCIKRDGSAVSNSQYLGNITVS
jgi:hypothetical protein